MADFDTSAQCRVEALQHVVGSTAIVAYTQAFWTYRALGDPLSVDITRLASVKHYELQESPKTKLRTTQNKQRVCFRQRHGVKIFSRNEILQFKFSYIRPSLSSPSIFSPSLSSPAMANPAKSSVNVQSCNFSVPLRHFASGEVTTLSPMCRKRQQIARSPVGSVCRPYRRANPVYWQP